MRKICIVFCLLLFIAVQLHAGGYQVRVQGQKQTGMGLTGTSLLMDASNIFYNPGGLALNKQKFSLSLGASGIFANTTFHNRESDYEARTDNPLRTPLYLYASHKIGKKFTVGMGIYTPYGSTAKWDEDWEGRYLIQDISLKAFYLQPTVAYQVNDWLGIGAGFIYATGDVTIHKALAYDGKDKQGQLTLEGTTHNYGYNAGVFIKATDKLNIGIDYRSKITMKLRDGDATFDVPEAIHQMGITEKNKFDADLPMPANLDFGISYKATKKLLIALELNWVQWNVYDSLIFKFKENGTKLNSHNPRKYKDSFIPRLGVQYAMCDKLTLRAGVYYDPTPTNKDYFNPETTSLNTVAFTLGLTYKPVKNLDIDISYLQLNGLEEERSYSPADFTGYYQVTTIIPGIGINYSF